MEENNFFKVFINKVGEGWILDRMREEWIQGKNPYTRYYSQSDIVWLIAPWVWKKRNYKKLSSKKVICSVHHIDEDKFDQKDLEEFMALDEFVNAYHVISMNTYEQVKKLTDKKIYSIPFWVNPNIWFPIEDKNSIRAKYDIDSEAYLVGSFQRDTEGSDLISPKLSKGPDRFIEIMKDYKLNHGNLHVLLAGKRRQYIISKLIENDIDFTYFEMASNKKLNELYNSLDLYIVTSRFEGGPQAIFECALTKTPIISTNVGVAPEILDRKSLFNMDNYDSALPNIEFAYSQAQKFIMPKGFNDFNVMFEEQMDEPL
jgi:glycosyltransferase involved in cell wall biosynthesis